MVAVSSSTVAKGRANMLAWALVALMAGQSLAHAMASPNIKYDVVDDEGVMIDRIEDYLRSRDDPRPPATQNKIKFAVGPEDPRYFLPSPYQAPSSPYSSPYSSPSNYFQPPSHPKMPLRAPKLPLLRPPPYPEYPAYDEEYGGSPYQDYADPLLQEEAMSLAEKLAALRGVNMGGVGGEDKRQMVPPSPQVRHEVKEEPQQPRLEEEKKKEDKKAALAGPATSQPEAVNYLNKSPAHAQQGQPTYHAHTQEHKGSLDGVYFVAIVAGCTAVAVFGVISAGICWYRLNKSHRAAQDADYPAYGVTGPNKDLSPSSGDRKLAQSAHMYHYQHQKQQMIALEKSSGGERHGSTSDVDSEEEGEENEYTVYECPGLAPTGEMEVKNPLFHDDPTPATPSMRKDDDEDDEDDEK